MKGEEDLLSCSVNWPIYRAKNLNRSNEADRWVRHPSCMHKSRPGRKISFLLLLNIGILVMKDGTNCVHYLS